MDKGLLHTSHKERNVDYIRACCEEFAQHFEGKIYWICPDLSAVVNTGHVDVTIAPDYPTSMVTFPFLLPDDVDQNPWRSEG